MVHLTKLSFYKKYFENAIGIKENGHSLSKEEQNKCKVFDGEEKIDSFK